MREQHQALPTLVSGPGLRPVALVVALAGLIFLALAAAVVWIGTTSVAHHPSESTWTRVVGEVGSWQVLPAVTLAITLAIALSGRGAAALLVVTAVAGAGALSYAAKLALGTLGAEDSGGRLADYPSAHEACIGALAGALVVIVWQETPNAIARSLAMGTAGAVTAVMGLARVRAGRHSVLDVVGGVALAVGWLASCLFLILEGKRARRRHPRS